jgi:hypothetical protein
MNPMAFYGARNISDHHQNAIFVWKPRLAENDMAWRKLYRSQGNVYYLLMSNIYVYIINL